MANRYRQSMTERTSVRLNPANIVAVRVAVELGQRLEKRRQILYWQEPKGSQRDIQSSGDVALGEDESVPFRIINGLGSDIQNGAVERGQNVDRGEIATNVASACVVHQLEILDADL